MFVCYYGVTKGYRGLHIKKAMVYEFDIKDFPQGRTSKTKLAGMLGTSRKTIQDYHRLAMSASGTYEDDFPSLVSGQTRTFITKVGLTPYQCWFLWVLWRMVAVEGLPKKCVSDLLANDLATEQRMSKKGFTNLYKKQETDHDNTRSICRVA